MEIGGEDCCKRYLSRPQFGETVSSPSGDYSVQYDQEGKPVLISIGKHCLYISRKTGGDISCVAITRPNGDTTFHAHIEKIEETVTIRSLNGAALAIFNDQKAEFGFVLDSDSERYVCGYLRP
jgi:hypothetical protein